MSKARYWLLLKIAESPKVFTYGAGLLVGCLVMLLTALSVLWFDRSTVAQQHANAISIFQAISTEGSELLEHLHTHDEFQCGGADLIHLNSHLLLSRYLREIGLLNEKMELVCSTALGMLNTPIKGNYPIHISRSGLQLLNKVPLAVADNTLEALIIMSPPFNVAISPFATAEVFSNADAIWLQSSKGLHLLHANVETAMLHDMQPRAATQQAPGSIFRGLNYEHITAAPDLDIVLQTRRDLPAIARDSGLLLPALLAGSLLVAMLAAGTIRPYVKKCGHLRNRIGFLCDEAHLALVYQPIFNLTTMRPVGCEVLARLKEGDKSWTPDRMIPAIQQAGLEYRFDRAVTRKAIRELATHLPAWDGVFDIALNYFPESVRPDTLVPVLTEALRAAGRLDLKVCVEITEHSLSSEVIAEVRALKAQGFQIAVDDFGTGYSNLRSVTQLSPDVLKIDRSFVHELEEASVRSSLIPEIVNIARSVNAQIVAEGIETPEQARLLASAGVRYGQGFALGRPMEMARFIAFLAKYR